MKILHIDSSITGQYSASRHLTAAVVRRQLEAHPDATVTYHNLVAERLAHLETGPAGDSESLKEFLAADIIVIGAPMYNFGVPSQLKAWMDHLAVVGKTFSYSSSGVPTGLCGGKRVIVASSRGGLYTEPSPVAAMDHQERYLQAYFAFLGVADLQIIRAEGLATGDEQRQRAMQSALAAASTLSA